MMKLLTKFSFFALNLTHGIRYWLDFSTSSIHGVRVIVLDGTKVLLVSHWYAPGAWTLPGGGVHRKKKEEPEAAAIREVWEETGLTVHSIKGELGRYIGRWGRGDQIIVFYTDDFSGSLSIKPNREIMSRSWFDLDKLPEELSPATRRRLAAYKDGVRDERTKW